MKINISKVIIVTTIGTGIYLLLSGRKTYAEEVSEIQPEISPIPATTKNPAINMVEQIVKQAEISLPTKSAINQMSELITSSSKGIFEKIGGMAKLIPSIISQIVSNPIEPKKIYEEIRPISEWANPSLEILSKIASVPSPSTTSYLVPKIASLMPTITPLPYMRNMANFVGKVGGWMFR